MSQNDSNMESVAVLIPVYNDQKGLEEALGSIREPDPSFTVVAVDDGSATPVTVDASRYPFQVVVLRMEKNGGIVKAMNRGLEFIREKGFKWVARLDAADSNRENRLSRQFAVMKQNPDLVLLGSNVEFVDEESGKRLFETRLPQSYDEVRRWIAFRNCFIHPSVMMRTDAVMELGGYSSAYPHIEDFVLFTNLVKKGRCENLGDVLVECKTRASGISYRNHRRQMLSGFLFKLNNPAPLNPLWYAYLAKRVAYMCMSPRAGESLKRLFRFVQSSNRSE